MEKEETVYFESCELTWMKEMLKTSAEAVNSIEPGTADQRKDTLIGVISMLSEVIRSCTQLMDEAYR